MEVSGARTVAVNVGAYCISDKLLLVSQDLLGTALGEGSLTVGEGTSLVVGT